MLVVGRMYLEANLLPEAQTAFVAGGKANGADGRAFRYLGEVLLRRGDAVRGEKVLARAIQLGRSDAETRLWYDRAAVYVSMQQRLGAPAVAQEVARSLPPVPPAPGPAPSARAQPPPPPPPPRVSAPLPPSTFAAEEPPTLEQGQRPPPPASRTAVLSPRTIVGGLQPPVDLPYGRGQAVQVASSRGGTPTAGRVAQAESEPSFDSLPTIVAQPAPPAPPAQPARYSPELEGRRARDMTPSFEDRPNPEPAIVLEHLARVGVYEPGGGAPPAWEAAVPQKTRGAWLLVLATIMVVAVGSGVWMFARQVKQQRAARARQLETEVIALIRGGKLSDLRTSDNKLSEAFDLDSLSPRAARLWLENRVLTEILTPGEARGIDAAVHRAKGVGLSEQEVACGRVAAYLAEGDLAGAAALLPRWDKAAGKDPYYQLTAGATLERAGDTRAIERYEAARSLDPKLVVADMLLARLALLELDVQQGKALVAQLKPKLGDGPALRALSALAWAVDPDRPRELPSDAHLEEEQRAALPAALQPVPYLVEALQAIDSDEPTRALRAIDRGIQQSSTPAMATRFGFLAVQAGDEKVARKAALHALKFAAVYPQARVLAARVALLGGRFDEAKRAIEELDPASVDVAVVRAILAYETLDSSELESAIERLGPEAQKRPALAAIVAAPGVLGGTRYPEAVSMTSMAAPQVAWGEPIALDAALDTGRLDLADAIANRFAETERPSYLVRLSRLSRYQNKHDAALKASERAFSGAATAPAFIERIQALLAADDAPAARDLLARYPALMGPMTEFLRVLVDARGKRAADAKVKAAQLELPPDEAPLIFRVLVARALLAAGDKRAAKYVQALAKSHGRHPDVVLAASGK